MTEKDYQVIEQARAALDAIDRVPCTGCQYCTKGCPQSINIPGIFNCVNTAMVYNNLNGAKGSYGWATNNGKKASDCVACGQCESVCPQHIGIIDALKKAAAMLEG